MEIINIHEAKTQLSKYLQEVSAGKEIIIGRYGEPIAKIVRYQNPAGYRFGLLKGKLRLSKEGGK